MSVEICAAAHAKMPRKSLLPQLSMRAPIVGLVGFVFGALVVYLAQGGPSSTSLSVHGSASAPPGRPVATSRTVSVRTISFLASCHAHVRARSVCWARAPFEAFAPLAKLPAAACPCEPGRQQTGHFIDIEWF